MAHLHSGHCVLPNKPGGTSALLASQGRPCRPLAPCFTPNQHMFPMPHFFLFFHAPCQAESVVLYPVLQSRLGQQGAQWAARALAVSQCST